MTLETSRQEPAVAVVAERRGARPGRGWRRTAGWGLVILGVPVFVLPIPLGLLMIAAGLLLLSRHSLFVRARLAGLRRRYPRQMARLDAAKAEVTRRLRRRA